MPKVVTQRCLEQDLNPRPTDRKSKCLTVAPPRHLAASGGYMENVLHWNVDTLTGRGTFGGVWPIETIIVNHMILRGLVNG